MSEFRTITVNDEVRISSKDLARMLKKKHGAIVRRIQLEGWAWPSYKPQETFARIKPNYNLEFFLTGIQAYEILCQVKPSKKISTTVIHDLSNGGLKL